MLPLLGAGVRGGARNLRRTHPFQAHMMLHAINRLPFAAGTYVRYVRGFRELYWLSDKVRRTPHPIVWGKLVIVAGNSRHQLIGERH